MKWRNVLVEVLKAVAAVLAAHLLASPDAAAAPYAVHAALQAAVSRS